jgi:TRAP-type mannitol/chloroaromatic compound transport system permease small subunit
VSALLRFAASIDRFNARLGRGLAWLVLAMVALGAYNAVARWLGRHLGRNLTSNAWIEAQWYLFATVFLVGAAWALSTDKHVRVDVLYGRLRERDRVIVDLVGAVVFLVPFCVFGLVESVPAVAASWAVWEGSPDPGGLPRYPIKTMIPIGFGLLLLQAVAEIVKNADRLRSPPRDARPPPPAGGAA